MIMATFTDIANQNNTHQSFSYDDDVYRFTSNNGQDWIYDRGGNNSVYLNGTVDMSKLKFVLTNSLIGQTNSLKITGYNANNAITINNFFALPSQHFKLYINNVLYQSKAITTEAVHLPTHKRAAPLLVVISKAVFATTGGTRLVLVRQIFNTYTQSGQYVIPLSY